MGVNGNGIAALTAQIARFSKYKIFYMARRKTNSAAEQSWEVRLPKVSKSKLRSILYRANKIQKYEIHHCLKLLENEQNYADV